MGPRPLPARNLFSPMSTIVKPLVPRQTCHPSRPWALKFPSRKFILWVTRRRYSTKYSSALVTSARLFIFRQDVRHTLPPEVNHMNEATQIALAMQVEERNCLQTELDLAARRSRYHTFTSHHHSLTVDKLQKKLDKVNQTVSAAVADAVKNHKAQQNPQGTDIQNPNTTGEFFFSVESGLLLNHV